MTEPEEMEYKGGGAMDEEIPGFMSDLKEFFKPCKEKIKMSIAIVTMSVNLMIFGIYFTRFHSLEDLSFYNYIDTD
ncbi:MAG: hypothetical protein K8R25_12875 [Methanosarcinales archaeon]|nr:hypothetical protein [Methanosarcinales archaeon]